MPNNFGMWPLLGTYDGNLIKGTNDGTLDCCAETFRNDRFGWLCSLAMEGESQDGKEN